MVSLITNLSTVACHHATWLLLAISLFSLFMFRLNRSSITWVWLQLIGYGTSIAWHVGVNNMIILNGARIFTLLINMHAYIQRKCGQRSLMKSTQSNTCNYLSMSLSRLNHIYRRGLMQVLQYYHPYFMAAVFVRCQWDFNSLSTLCISKFRTNSIWYFATTSCAFSVKLHWGRCQ